MRYFNGVPSPVKHTGESGYGDLSRKHQNITPGIEYATGTPEAQKVLGFIEKEFPKSFDKIRFNSKEKAEEFWKAVGAKDFPAT